MRIEYIIVGFVILLVVLLVSLTMLGGVKEGLDFILKFFK